MKKSSSSCSLSDSSDPQTEVAITQQWLQSKIKISKDLILCPICYEYVYQPIQCQNCGRLFCKQDYNSTKIVKNCCPLCKTSPWNKKQSLHICYKSILDQVRFKCQICQAKNISHSQLRQHLEQNHKKKIKLCQDIIYDYTLTFKDGRVRQLDFQENLQINYCRKIMNETVVSIFCSEEIMIELNLVTNKFVTSKTNAGIITFKQSQNILHDTQYITWSFIGHNDVRQFYSAKNQIVIEKQYKNFLANDKLTEIHLDLVNADQDTLRYRLMFGTMKQVNVSTGFKRTLIREEICFKKQQ